tara:strand:- start:854 stop:1105 length:252 start_codon:yes stop_codon:yes gene_type:complete
MTRHRAFHVEFYGPTNTKGARIRVKDMRQGTRVFLSYDYALGDVLEQASRYLTEKEITPDVLLLHDTTNGFTIGSENFITPLT